MLQTCMNLYSQNDSVQIIKPNPFKKSIPRSLKKKPNIELFLDIKQKSKLKTDFRNRINGTFRYSLKRLNVDSLNKEYYYFYTIDQKYQKAKLYSRQPKPIVQNKRLHKGRIWQIQVDQPNYNLLYFYNQMGRTLTGKKNTLRLMLDNITKKLIFKTYFYEHLMQEITVFETIFPFQKSSKKVFLKKKENFEALLALDRIIHQKRLFFKFKILDRRLSMYIADGYYGVLQLILYNIRKEFDWWYFINRGKLHTWRHRYIAVDDKRKFRIYYRDEHKICYHKLRTHPRRRHFKFSKIYVKNLRLLIDELYDPNGAIHLEAINTLFNGHLKNVQIVRYFLPFRIKHEYSYAYNKRILNELIYGYNLHQNKLYNVSRKKFKFLRKCNLLFIRQNLYIRKREGFHYNKENFYRFNPRMYMDQYFNFKVQFTASRKMANRIGFIKKLRRYSLYEYERF